MPVDSAPKSLRSTGRFEEGLRSRDPRKRAAAARRLSDRTGMDRGALITWDAVVDRWPELLIPSHGLPAFVRV